MGRSDGYTQMARKGEPGNRWRIGTAVRQCDRSVSDVHPAKPIQHDPREARINPYGRWCGGGG
jgi:hypothetical protein